MELYKETLYDLLSSKCRKEDCAVDLREDPKSGVKIVNLTEVLFFFERWENNIKDISLNTIFMYT